MSGTSYAAVINSAVQDAVQKTVPTGSAEQLVATSPTVFARQGVVVQALSTNTVAVWVGSASVAVGSRGLELLAGQSVTVPVGDPSKIYCITASGTQKLNVLWA